MYVNKAKKGKGFEKKCVCVCVCVCVREREFRSRKDGRNGYAHFQNLNRRIASWTDRRTTSWINDRTCFLKRRWFLEWSNGYLVIGHGRWSKELPTITQRQWKQEFDQRTDKRTDRWTNKATHWVACIRPKKEMPAKVLVQALHKIFSDWCVCTCSNSCLNKLIFARYRMLECGTDFQGTLSTTWVHV